MEDIMEYRTVCEAGDWKKLDKAVNALINEGYEVYGSVSTCVDADVVYFTQTMVKRIPEQM